MPTFSLISVILLLAIFIPSVAATGLNIDPVNKATFSLYVVLAAYTVFQSVRAFGILRRPHPKSTKEGEHITPERVPYAKIFLATITLIICYVLQTIWIPIDLSKDSLGSTLNNTFYGMLAADQLSDIFIASALLHLIDHRRDVLGRRHTDDEPTTTKSISSTKKRCLDTILLSFMAGVTLVGLLVGTVVTRTIPDPDTAYIIFTAIYHTYILMYMVATLDIALSAWFLWRRLPVSVALNEKVSLWIMMSLVSF
jgi:hypothetical protein